LSGNEKNGQDSLNEFNNILFTKGKTIFIDKTVFAGTVFPTDITWQKLAVHC